MKKILILVVLWLIIASFSIQQSIAQWIQTNGPYGGSVRSLAVLGVNLFAGTEGSGVFLSTDYGTKWNKVNNGLTNTSVLCLAVSGMNLFAGTTHGIFLSTDDGANWTAVDSGFSTIPIVYSLAVSAQIFLPELMVAVSSFQRITEQIGLL